MTALNKGNNKSRKQETMNQTNFTNNNRIANYLEHPVKVTALEYLKEALHTERYEDCWQILEVAKEFGANNNEIWEVINRNARFSASPKPETRTA